MGLTYSVFCIKQLINKGLLYNTGSYTQYFVVTYKGKDSEKTILTHISESFVVYLKLTKDCKSIIFQKKKPKPAQKWNLKDKFENSKSYFTAC